MSDKFGLGMPGYGSGYGDATPSVRGGFAWTQRAPESAEARATRLADEAARDEAIAAADAAAAVSAAQSAADRAVYAARSIATERAVADAIRICAQDGIVFPSGDVFTMSPSRRQRAEMAACRQHLQRLQMANAVDLSADDVADIIAWHCGAYDGQLPHRLQAVEESLF